MMFVHKQGYYICSTMMMMFIIILALYQSVTIQAQHSALLKDVGVRTPVTFGLSTHTHHDDEAISNHVVLKKNHAPADELAFPSSHQTETSNSQVSMGGSRRKRNTDDDDFPVCPANVQTSEVCALTQAWSCRSRCRHQALDSLTGTGTYCSCSSTCLVLTNCCEDFEAACPSTFAEAAEELNQFSNITASCDYRMDRLLISTCPESSPKALRQGCESTENVTDPSLLIPVSDTKTGYNYKNLMCHKCWSHPDLSEDTVRYWRVSSIFKMNGEYGDQYSAQPLLDRIVEHPELVKWTEPFPATIPAAKCNTSAVQECSGCWSSYLVDKCTQFHSQVTLNDISYKNRYCYFCSSEFLQRLGESTSGTSRLRLCSNPNDKNVPHDMDEFSVSMSFDTQGQFVLAQTSRGLRWQEMQCSAGDNCNVQKCNFKTIPNGDTCSPKVVHFVLLDICRPHENGNSVCKPSQAGKSELSVHALTSIIKPLFEQKIHSEFSNTHFRPELRSTDTEDIGGVARVKMEFTAIFVEEEEGYPQLEDIVKKVGAESLSVLRQKGSWIFCVQLKLNVPWDMSTGGHIGYPFHRCHSHDFQEQHDFQEASSFWCVKADWTLLVILIISVGGVEITQGSSF